MEQLRATFIFGATRKAQPGNSAPAASYTSATRLETRAVEVITGSKGTYAVRRPMEASKRYTYVCYVANPSDSAERVALAKPPAALLDAGLLSREAQTSFFCV